MNFHGGVLLGSLDLPSLQQYTVRDLIQARTGPEPVTPEIRVILVPARVDAINDNDRTTLPMYLNAVPKKRAATQGCSNATRVNRRHVIAITLFGDRPKMRASPTESIGI